MFKWLAEKLQTHIYINNVRCLWIRVDNQKEAITQLQNKYDEMVKRHTTLLRDHSDLIIAFRRVAERVYNTEKRLDGFTFDFHAVTPSVPVPEGTVILATRQEIWDTRSYSEEQIRALAELLGIVPDYSRYDSPAPKKQNLWKFKSKKGGKKS